MFLEPPPPPLVRGAVDEPPLVLGTLSLLLPPVEEPVRPSPLSLSVVLVVPLPRPLGVSGLSVEES